MALGRAQGLELAGYALGPDFLGEFGGLVATPHPQVTVVTQDRIGGPGLWLRAEPGEDTGQADALAAIVAISLAQTEAA
jgi:hypothetical protein